MIAHALLRALLQEHVRGARHDRQLRVGIASYIEQVCARVATSSSPAITSTGTEIVARSSRRERRLGERHDPRLLLDRAGVLGPSGECSPKRWAHSANSSLSVSKLARGISPSKW
jgi:hypothetical protein